MKQRNTPQLAATFAVLARATDHPTAEQVLARVRRRLPSVSLGTVYRNLEKLRAQGSARVVYVGQGVARYDAMVADHDHFVCNGCGSVTDLARLPQPADVGSLSGAGFVVHSHSVAVYGLCRRCAASRRGRAKPSAPTAGLSPRQAGSEWGRASRPPGATGAA